MMILQSKECNECAKKMYEYENIALPYANAFFDDDDLQIMPKSVSNDAPQEAKDALVLYLKYLKKFRSLYISMDIS